MANETGLTIIGNLTADAELRYTQNGLAVANFTVASTPRTFDRQANEWKDGDALFIRCSVWREMGEHVAGSLTKGSRVIVVGNLEQRSYESKADAQGKGGGEKRTSLELVVTEIGPSLRYATASLTRTEQAGGGQRPQQGQRAAGARAEAGGDVWGAPAPASAAQPQGGQPSWNDETPF